ncbi:zinc finger protein 630-like [Pongo abelii]|uniref:zinc finger protein 630-like n=1 Tax=Pongo abelii TaxID=9601 RepID=UPI0023E78D87|nr:zinc finger protein 630-like [Pongo abelii]
MTVDFSREEWQHLDPAQRCLYWDMTLENYSHPLSVGYQVPKSEATFKLEQREGPWTLEGEAPHKSYSGLPQFSKGLLQCLVTSDFPVSGSIISEGCKTAKMVACPSVWEVCLREVPTCCQPKCTCRRWLETLIGRSHSVRRNRIWDPLKKTGWPRFCRAAVLCWGSTSAPGCLRHPKT